LVSIICQVDVLQFFLLLQASRPHLGDGDFDVNVNVNVDWEWWHVCGTGNWHFMWSRCLSRTNSERRERM